MRPGDRLRVFGASREFEATLVRCDKQSAVVRLDNEIPAIPPAAVHLSAAFPCLKGDRTEMLVQKLTEIGVAEFVVFHAEREVAHASDGKLDRLRRAALEACKQCGRVDLPQIHQAASLLEALTTATRDTRRFVLHEICREPHLSTALRQHEGTGAVLVATGPEGGFTPGEIALVHGDATVVSLGRRILRAETAPIVAASLVMAAAGEF